MVCLEITVGPYKFSLNTFDHVWSFWPEVFCLSVGYRTHTCIHTEKRYAQRRRTVQTHLNAKKFYKNSHHELTPLENERLEFADWTAFHRLESYEARFHRLESCEVLPKFFVRIGFIQAVWDRRNPNFYINEWFKQY